MRWRAANKNAIDFGEYEEECQSDWFGFIYMAADHLFRDLR
jgi:hypothetical protein